MTDGQAFPTWEDKTNALRDAISWAAGGICGEWAYKHEAATLPDDNDAWFELRMGRMLEIGVDESRNEDNIDPSTGEIDFDNPRAEVSCGQRQFMIEVRFFNRDQEHDVVAWLVADRARTRLRMSYPRDKWLRPNVVSIVELLNVIPMPNPKQVIDMRWQSEAVIEMDFATIVAERDKAAVGTWIEKVQMAGTFGCALDPGPFDIEVDASTYVTSGGSQVTSGGVPITSSPATPPTPSP
jgi:hypothetical protein